jgi:hypothetical protein
MPRVPSLTTAVLACCAFSMLANGARSEPASAKQEIVGTWTLVSIKYVEADGRSVEPFGPGAKGLLYFDAAGRFATQVMRADRPLFQSNNRMIGSPEENKAVSQGVVAYFGTYSIDEPNHVVTLHIEQSSFPNWNETDQKRIFKFVNDEFRYTAASSTANPAESAELVWKRAR